MNSATIKYAWFLPTVVVLVAWSGCRRVVSPMRVTVQERPSQVSSAPARRASFVRLCAGQTGWLPQAPVIKVTATDGVTVVSWLARTGHPLRLLLPKPVALPGGFRHLDLHACVVGQGYTPSVGCTFLVGNADGRLHTRKTSSISMSWERHSTYAYQKKPPVSLLGLQLTPRADGLIQVVLGPVKAQMVRRGAIGDYWGVLPSRWSPRFQAYFAYGAEPFIYADYLVHESGSYTVVLTAQKQWQGATVWQTRVGFTFRSGPEAPSEKGPVINLSPGNYWITAHVFNGSGQYLSREEFQVDILRRNQVLPSLGGAVGKPLALEVGTQEPSNVFPYGVEPRFRVFLPSAASYPLTLRYQIRGFYGKTVLHEPEVKVTHPGVVWWQPEGMKLENGQVYQIHAECLHGSVTVDTAQALFGLSNAPHRTVVSGPQPPKRPPVAGPSREQLAVDAYWEPYSYGGRPYSFKSFQRLVALAKANHCSEVRIDLNWPTLEPLPGVFRFHSIDRMVKTIEAAGLNVAFEVYGFYQVPPWVRSFDSMADSQGDIHNLWYAGGVHRVPSPSDPRFLAALSQLWRALAARYGHDPDVSGYAFLGLFADHFYFDRQPGTTVDYSAAAERSFRWFLHHHRGYSLAKLAKRYHARYRTWSEVNLPQPSAAVGAWPRIPRRWSDFLAFRRWTFQRYVHAVVRAIRSGDSLGYIHLYQLGEVPMGSVVDYLAAHGGALDDGGDEQESGVASASPLLYLRNLGDFSESVAQMPQSRYTIYMLFTKLYYSGAGGNFRWLWNMSGGRNAANKAHWLEIMRYFGRRWQPVLNRMYAARAPELDLAVLSPISGNPAEQYLGSYLKSQAWPSVWLGGLLLQDHQFPYWVGRWNHPTSALRGAKLAFVAGNMIVQPSSHYWDSVAAWVRRGGKLVLMSPASGRWALNHRREDFYLLGKMGLGLERTNKRLHDQKVLTNGQTPFSGGQVVPLANIGLNGKPGFQELKPVGHYKTLASFSDGSPAIIRFNFGKGEVVLFLQTVDCFTLRNLVDPNHGIVAALCRWGGVKRFFDSNQPNFRLCLLRDGKSIFLLVHHYQPPSWFTHPDIRVLSGMVQVKGLAPQTRYIVRELTHPNVRPLSMSGRRLGAEGFQVEKMAVGETRVYEITAMVSGK